MTCSEVRKLVKHNVNPASCTRAERWAITLHVSGVNACKSCRKWIHRNQKPLSEAGRVRLLVTLASDIAAHDPEASKR